MTSVCDVNLYVEGPVNGALVIARIDSLIAQLTTPVGNPNPTYVEVPGTPDIVNATITCITAGEADQLYAGIVWEWTNGPTASKFLANSFLKRVDNFDDEGQGKPDYIPYQIAKP